MTDAFTIKTACDASVVRKSALCWRRAPVPSKLSASIADRPNS